MAPAADRPEHRRGRRSRLQSRLGGAARRQRQQAERRLRYVEGKAEGFEARRAGAGMPRPADDRAVIGEIKAALARLDYPTTDVNVDVVDGVATLRGQLKRPEQVREVREVVAAVPGVVRVESFLHLPGTPAPNKADALSAAGGAGSVIHHGA